ncbi:urea ABC transporter permease subunit UrtB [Chelatococcus reniformis]|uniref:Branched-chain amino acid ABC transporter permease n=1 Tax=Chelatococcus reniformis TaxID=1494448 RepID=A0A916UX41_9HYPH|nr:urea ABC transporter permease subunit UrtB [Chelatococcus reniformis]GGC91472.1 branched-chain amino acid ABC transporter permease [Chelatococcus reniformis]
MVRLFALVLLLVGAFAGRPACAQDLDAALAKLAGASGYAEIDAGVAALAATGSPDALPIIEALGEGRLYVDPQSGVLVLKTADGRTVDAKSGAAVSANAAQLAAVRVNNRVRRAIESSMGALRLVAKDSAVRAAAADAVFKARDPAALPAIDRALARETDAGVKQKLTEAQAAARLMDGATGDADKIAAVAVVSKRGDQDALSLLGAAGAQASPAVKPAIESATATIQSRLALLENVQNVWYGISLGSVLLLAAIGLAITFGVMGIINMAHGEMVMLGAYTTYVVQEASRIYAPGLFGWTLPVAVPLAFLIAGLVGVLIERTVIRYLYGRPLETLLATWGISLILQQAVRSVFGPTNREVGAPSYMSGSFDVFGLSITYGRMWIVLFSLVVFLGLLAVLRGTSFGLKMRAVTQNRRMASSMGIRTPWIDTFAFGLGSGIAGIAGVALAQIDNVSPNLGQGYIIDSFLVVVFGGVGNLWGTLVAALTLGVANKLLEPFAGAVLGKILLLIFIILFIQRRPRGLFAQKGRAVEA